MRAINILLSILFVVWSVSGERIQDQMYIRISGASCFRRLNGTHSTGCSSRFSGSSGVLHLIQEKSDFNFVLNTPPAPPYILIVPPQLFTRDNIMRVIASGKKNVAGIVIPGNRTGLEHFSQESMCPNAFGGLLKNQTCDVNTPEKTWNPYGTGLLLEDIPFPVYFVSDDKEQKQIVKCYHDHNSFDIDNQYKRSLCSMQIKSFMSAAVSSEVCIRRTRYVSYITPVRFCDPLQGKNVYTTLFSRENDESSTNENFIAIGTRIDTTTMFDGINPGALDSVIPLVTLVSVVHTLKELANIDSNDKKNYPNIIFFFFNGESYDYIGSQRLVYDIQNGYFPSKMTNTKPIRMDQIKFFVDISSLDNMNLFGVYRYKQFPMAERFTSLMSNYSDKYQLNINAYEKISENLPPSSSHSFLRENVTFPAVILHSQMHATKNRFYHSVFDDKHNINYTYFNESKDFTTLGNLNVNVWNVSSIQMKIRNVSSLLTLSLYQLISGQEVDQPFGANPYLIDELLHCFLENANCSVFKAATKPGTIIGHNTPPSRYISVQASPNYETTAWIYLILGYLSGDRIDKHENECNVLPLSWISGITGTGECRRTKQNMSEAYSPAFIIDNYDWKSGKYSTWTESTWSEMNARLFIQPPTSHRALTLSLGLVVMTIFFIFVYLVKTRSETLFLDPVGSDTIQSLQT